MTDAEILDTHSKLFAVICPQAKIGWEVKNGTLTLKASIDDTDDIVVCQGEASRHEIISFIVTWALACDAYENTGWKGHEA